MPRTWEVPAFNKYEALSVALGVPATVAHVTRRVANLHSALGHYYVAEGTGAGIRVRRADGATPRAGFGGSGGFQLDVMATGVAADISPALLERFTGAIILWYENAGNTHRTESGDRGETWSAPVSQLPGILPAAARGNAHEELLVTVQADNSLLGTWQATGDRWPNDTHTGSTEGASSAAPFVLVDTAGAALVTDGTGPALSWAADGRFVLAVRIGSESDLSHWVNGDGGRTWQRVT